MYACSPSSSCTPWALFSHVLPRTVAVSSCLIACEPWHVGPTESAQCTASSSYQWALCCHVVAIEGGNCRNPDHWLDRDATVLATSSLDTWAADVLRRQPLIYFWVKRLVHGRKQYSLREPLRAVQLTPGHRPTVRSLPQRRKAGHRPDEGCC